MKLNVNNNTNVDDDDTINSSSSIAIQTIQLDESGRCVPLVIIDDIRQITSDHVEYRMKWSGMGEKIAKIVFKLIKDRLEKKME